jgi:tRNA (guanine-N7-)-methyltransferase
MQAASRPIRSAQSDVHPRLVETLRRHFGSAWRQPAHAPTLQAFASLNALRAGDARPLLLDSGCGNGVSTLTLAERHPRHCVIGIDQSVDRLRRLAPSGLAVHGNAILLRAELASFWRLSVAAGWRAERHYLLYPNPWPKAAQFSRRWHGHPVFPELMRTALAFELRTNWPVYAIEFAAALKFARHERAAACVFECDEPLTPFERKYRDSEHELWRVTSDST